MLRERIRYDPLALFMTRQRTLTAQRMLDSLPARSSVFAAVVATFIWAFWVDSGTIGYIAETKDGATTVSAGTRLGPIIVSLLSVVLYPFLVSRKVEVQNGRIASMWRRAAAFAVDFWFALFTLSTLFGFAPVLLEARRTGVFHWHFQRDYAALSDRFDIVLLPAFMCAFVAYFAFPLMKGSQTVGCWILRLATVNDNGYVVYLPFSTAIRRLLAEFRGLCSPIRSFRTRDAEGRTFYDIDSGFTVIHY
jgi:uncharacterized RDD family membrane protein YckC